MFNLKYSAARLHSVATQLEDAKTELQIRNALFRLHTVQQEIFKLAKIHNVWSE